MINVNCVLKLFNDLVRQKYSESTEIPPTAKDHELADHLFLLFDQLLNSEGAGVDNIVTLDFDDYNDDDENFDEDDDGGLAPTNDTKYSYDTMCTSAKYSKTYTFRSLRHRYKQIKHKEQLRRMKQYVNFQGTKVQKLQQIDKFIYAEFVRIRELSLPIHDCNVRRLAMKKARSLNLPDFVASHHWLSDFKRRHHISSRKIIKLGTKHDIEDRETTLKSAENFVIKVKDRLVNYAADHILNSD